MDLLDVTGACLLFGSVSFWTIKLFNRKGPRSSSEVEHSIEYVFSKSKKSPQKKLIEVINNAKKTLDIAIYTITETEILFQLISATNRGVKVRLITDREQSNGKYSRKALDKLTSAGIPIKLNEFDGLMHLKIMIADVDTVATGSYNYTYSAEKKNEEVVLIIKNNNIATEWLEKFNTMWNDEINYKLANEQINKRHA
jgi:phosphatidylserine/phosphatidylglycerophosphate/cardiolipin synthase-like enzyme